VVDALVVVNQTRIITLVLGITIPPLMLAGVDEVIE
jgi:hypothetical protein